MDIASGSTLGAPTLPAPRLRPLPAGKASPDGGEAGGSASGTALPADSLSLSAEGVASAAARPMASSAAPLPDPVAGPTAAPPAPVATPAATRAAGAAGSSCANPLPPPTGLKSFAYGILGVDRPHGQKPAQEEDYSAGQWVGAALKIAGVVALIA